MAINLDPNYRSGFSRQQGIEARRKMELILSVLSDKPMTAMDIAKITKLAEPTVRHHLHTMEKRQQIASKVMKKVFGDAAKRYFDKDTDFSAINFERQHRDRFIERTKKMCEFMRGTIRHKMEVATEFDTKRKTMETILRDMVVAGLIKTVPAKQFPWRAAVNYYVTTDTPAAQIKASKKAVEAKYAGMKKNEIENNEERFEKPVVVPDLPPNLLAMMGYTSVKPPEGKQYNVDEYSASHPDWNKFQERKGIGYSNIGCSMQMMIESAPGAI